MTTPIKKMILTPNEAFDEMMTCIEAGGWTRPLTGTPSVIDELDEYGGPHEEDHTSWN